MYFAQFLRFRINVISWSKNVSVTSLRIRILFCITLDYLYKLTISCHTLSRLFNQWRDLYLKSKITEVVPQPKLRKFLGRTTKFEDRGIRNIFPRRERTSGVQRRTFYRGLSCRESISVRKWRGGNFRVREVLSARKTFAHSALSRWNGDSCCRKRPRDQEVANLSRNIAVVIEFIEYETLILLFFSFFVQNYFQKKSHLFQNSLKNGIKKCNIFWIICFVFQTRIHIRILLY